MDKIEKLKTKGVPRSSEWNKVRKKFLANHNKCAACGTNKDLQVHHVKPFHIHPELELDPSNFIALCEGMERNCHRFIGHLNDFSSINVNSRRDASTWLNKIAHKPKWDKKTMTWKTT